MKAKLNLAINEKLLAQVKAYAAQGGQRTLVFESEHNLFAFEQINYQHLLLKAT